MLSYLLPAIFSLPVIESALNLIYEDASAPKKLIKGKVKPHKRYAGKQKAGIALATLTIALYFSAALTQPLPTTLSTAGPQANKPQFKRLSRPPNQAPAHHPPPLRPAQT